MLRLIGRLIVVPLGFLIGALVALAVLLTLGLERITHALAGKPLEAGGLEVLVDLAQGMIGLAGASTIVPAVLVVIVGEVARIRSTLYYVLGGGIAVAILPLIARGNAPAGGGAASLVTLWPVLATAGFAGGLVYWMIAGRRA
jgi:hypothetical protein